MIWSHIPCSFSKRCRISILLHISHTSKRPPHLPEPHHQLCRLILHDLLNLLHILRRKLPINPHRLHRLANLVAPLTRSATTSPMPLPRVAPSDLRALPSLQRSLRVSTTGHLLNRGPIGIVDHQPQVAVWVFHHPGGLTTDTECTRQSTLLAQTLAARLGQAAEV